jgi:hypothetical protein
MTDEVDAPFLPTELFGFEGTLLDPNWAEVRGIYRGLWFWSDDLVAYYADQLKWQEIEAQIKAKMDPRARLLVGNEKGQAN